MNDKSECYIYYNNNLSGFKTCKEALESILFNCKLISNYNLDDCSVFLYKPIEWSKNIRHIEVREYNDNVVCMFL